MTTDITVTSKSFQAEKRSWMLSQWGQGPGENPSITLKTSAFTAGTHYPDGYFPSGLALGRITASGLYGPYDAGASDGRQVCRFLLHSSVAAPADTSKNVGGAGVCAGFIKLNKLPIALPTSAQTDLKLCHFTA